MLIHVTSCLGSAFHTVSYRNIDARKLIVAMFTLKERMLGEKDVKLRQRIPSWCYRSVR